MDKVNEDYWYNQWHLDTELHQSMNLKNVTPIPRNEEVSIYADTDSCDGSSFIITDKGKLTIEDWYNQNSISGGKTIKGHESVLTSDKILNYSNNGELYFAPVKRIIRHSVSKPKWKLKTKSGKEVIITDDHSMIVFRNGEKLEVKPSQIKSTDRILIIEGAI